MANIESGNSVYIDATGALSAKPNQRVVQVLLTATAASARIVLTNGDTTTVKLDLRVATSGETGSFVFDYPIVFSNGVHVLTLTNAVATLIYTREGSTT